MNIKRRSFLGCVIGAACYRISLGLPALEPQVIAGTPGPMPYPTNWSSTTLAGATRWTANNFENASYAMTFSTRLTDEQIVRLTQ